MKTIELDVAKGTSDKEIIAQATAEMMKGFRVEIEDVKNPLHPPYNRPALKVAGRTVNDMIIDVVDKLKQQDVEVISSHRIRVGGKVYKKADIIAKHGMEPYQYNYLRCIKKYSMSEIFEKGKGLYVRKLKSA